MKQLFIAFIGAVFACALVGCTSPQMKDEHKAERQALTAKQKADRKVERAQDAVATTTAANAAAKANLLTKKQAQAEADANLQSILCPQPAQ